MRVIENGIETRLAQVNQGVYNTVCRVFQQLVSAVCLSCSVTVTLSYKHVCSFPGLWVARDDIRSV